MRGLEDWDLRIATIETPELRARCSAIIDNPAGKRLLQAVFGNSPYLSHSLLQDIPLFLRFLAEGPDPLLSDIRDKIKTALPRETDRASAMRELRIARRKTALIVALCDITELWNVDQVIKALSASADGLISAAVAFLLGQAHDRGDLQLPQRESPEENSGYVVLALGKLGGCELNYSSDVDLIVLFDADRAAYRHSRGPQEGFVRMTRDLVRLLEERTADGYVCRTDLRLRPDPAATPLAIPYVSALLYYEGMGQNWERAAMIKARPMAGDLELGREFLGELRPFVWRKNLDFLAIQDIHSIKRQIHAEKGGGAIAVLGHNVKLGRGGIREIEFFAQTQQLIWGGRDPSLRSPRTAEALDGLVTSSHIDRTAAQQLTEAYFFLRRVENRLQMVADQQTHTLPDDESGVARFAAFLGYNDSQSFQDALLARLRLVEDHYAALFEESPTLSGPGNLVFTGGDPEPGTRATLQSMGFRDPDRVFNLVSGWHRGRYRATRSVRSRQILTEILPTLLEKLGGTTDPDQALVSFHQFLAGLPAGAQLFSLLYANPSLLDLLAEIMGSAPALAKRLGEKPDLLEAVLAQGFFDPLPPLETLSAELQESLDAARDFQDVLDLSRRWANDRRFQVGVHILHQAEDVEVAGHALSDIAEAVVSSLTAPIMKDFARRHGRLAGARMAVLALGKLGGREMTVSSDLDLILLYDVAADSSTSDGPRPLDTNRYFMRLAQSFVNALTALTPEGSLYEIDLRLRPSGNAGPLAAPVEGFARYQREEAWTWEHMALTRARVIAGDRNLATLIDEIVETVLTAPRDAERLRRDVAEMRARIARERPSNTLWDIKDVRGGLIDLEFIAQYLQLRHAAAFPEMVNGTTHRVFEKAARAGLLPAERAAQLVCATRLVRQVQAVLRLTTGGEAGLDVESAPEGLKRLLAAACGAGSFAHLRDDLAATTARVQSIFQETIGNPE